MLSPVLELIQRRGIDDWGVTDQDSIEERTGVFF